QRLRREAGLLALAVELLHGDITGGVHLGTRDDPCRTVLVPHPDVLHLDVEERVARLGHHLEIELVAEVRGVLREDAVAEQAEDCRVLLLQPELELGLEFIQFIEMTHASESSAASTSATRPRPGTTRSGSRSSSGSRAKARSCRRG